MELLDHARAARRQWLVVLLCALVGVAVGALSVLLTTPQYASTVSVYLQYPTSTPDSTAKGTSKAKVATGLSDLEMEVSYRRLRSLAGLTTTAEVLRPIAHSLNMGATSSEITALADRVHSRVVPGSAEIDVTVTDPDPALAQRLSGRIAVALVGKIDDLEGTAGGGSRITARAGTEPEVSDGPVTPEPLKALGLGLLLGLAGGLAIAVARQRLDPTIRTAEALVSLTGVPNLTVVGPDPAPPPGPIEPRRIVDSPGYEPYRQLRTSLQFVDRGQFPRRLVVTSAMSGEGRTATACHLALTLARAGVRVVLVEGDVQAPRLATYLDLDPSVGLTSVLIGRDEPESVLQYADGTGDLPLEVMVSGPIPPNAGDMLRSRATEFVLRELEQRADVVIVDAPPLLPRGDAALLARICDGAVMVVRHGRTTGEQVTAALGRLQEVDARLLGTVLTCAPRDLAREERDDFGLESGRGGLRESGRAGRLFGRGFGSDARRGSERDPESDREPDRESGRGGGQAAGRASGGHGRGRRARRAAERAAAAEQEFQAAEFSADFSGDYAGEYAGEYAGSRSGEPRGDVRPGRSGVPFEQQPAAGRQAGRQSGAREPVITSGRSTARGPVDGRDPNLDQRAGQGYGPNAGQGYAPGTARGAGQGLGSGTGPGFDQRFDRRFDQRDGRDDPMRPPVNGDQGREGRRPGTPNRGARPPAGPAGPGGSVVPPMPPAANGDHVPPGDQRQARGGGEFTRRSAPRSHRRRH